jgi:adenylate cyclase
MRLLKFKRTGRIYALFILFFLIGMYLPEQIHAQEINRDSLRKVAFGSFSNVESKIQSAHLLVRTYITQNKYDSANFFLKLSFRWLEGVENNELLANTWYLQGKFNIGILDYDQAMKSFMEADKLYRIEGMEKEHGLTEMQFGILMYAQSNYKASIGFFNTAFQILTQMKDTFNYLTCYYLYGLANLEVGKFKEAELALNETLSQTEMLGFKQREMECRVGLANLYLDKGEFQKAIKFIVIPLEYAKATDDSSTGNQVATSRAEFIYGMAAFGLKDYETSRIMLENSFVHLKTLRNYAERIKTSEALIKLFSETKNYDAALEQMNIVLQFKDSLSKMESEKTLNVFQDRQNIQEQNAQIELLTFQQEKDKILRISLIVLVALLLILSITWFQKFKFRREANRKLDELLLNILPVEVAEELKAKGHASSKSYNSVSVVFVDMVAFTKLSEKLSANELVAELHSCFSEFDKISSKYNLEKIKTLGDAYMCAGGIPVENDSHPFDAIYASREIIEFIESYNQKKSQDFKIELRIGIHSGPVVAGVVGLKKFAYDIWGDTVNIAARLEQAGEAGRINISESTYQLVKDQIRCSSRGKINAKYKGDINMYFVS